MIETLHHLLVEVAEYGIIAFEFIGVILLVWAGIKGLICLAKKDHHVGLVVAKELLYHFSFYFVLKSLS